MTPDPKQECEHDYENSIGRGRARHECQKCGEDITLELVLMYEAQEFSDAHRQYERISHIHCWNEKQPSACGISLEKHKQCCLCELLVPKRECGRCACPNFLPFVYKSTRWGTRLICNHCGKEPPKGYGKPRPQEPRAEGEGEALDRFYAFYRKGHWENKVTQGYIDYFAGAKFVLDEIDREKERVVEEIIKRLTELAEVPNNLIDAEEGKVKAVYLDDAIATLRKV